MQANDGHPPTGSPNTIVFITMTQIMINAARQETSPNIDAMANGAVEKAIIPWSEYLNSFQNDHLVSPATRSTFS